MPSEQVSLEEKYKLVLETIKKYPDQLKQAWDEISAMELPSDFHYITNIVVCGMGGSALGARVVDSLISDRSQVPIEIFNQYHVPYYTGGKTLVITSSYSGNTEETVSCLNEALNKGAKIFGITTGGKLAEIITANNLPSYIFDPKNNPSKQPRMAIGYAVGAILALLAKLKVVYIGQEDIEAVVETMKKTINNYGVLVEEGQNPAKSYAQRLHNRVPILIASEHLTGTVYTIKDQFNESAKTFSVLFDLPELNHHLMEGLKNPVKLREIFYFIFFNSKLYSDRVAKRYPLTTEVVEKNGYAYSVFSAMSEKKLNQVFETLVFGSFVAYYLSQTYGIDPTSIPWVDYFKEKLAKV